MASLSFQPPGLVTYDFFCTHARGRYHLFYLQRRRVPDDADPDEHSIGHAVSDDLVRWEIQPVALRKGPDGSWDDRTLWTMSVLERDGLYRMLYTGLTSGDDRRVQRVGLATSPDLFTWTKYPGNPVIQVDPRWYETRPTTTVQGRVSWRDPFLYEDPESGHTYAFITARVNGGEAARRGCVGVARARDRELTGWDVLPPVFAPGKYNDHIVSEVFRQDGRYYLLYSAHHYVGTHYAISDQLLSGYAEPVNHWLLGTGGRHAWIGRTFLDKAGRRLLLHWNYEREGGTDLGPPTFGKLSTPKVVEVDPGGLLRLTWWDGLDAYAGASLLEGALPSLAAGATRGRAAYWTAGEAGSDPEATDGLLLRGDRLDGFSVLAFGADGDDFIYDATIRVESGRAAGLMLRGDDVGHRGYAVMLDATRSAVDVRELPYLDLLETRYVRSLASEREHTLRVVAKEEFIEVYLDGEFLIPLTTYAHRRGAFGVVVEGAAATFSGLRARPLKPAP